MGKNTLVTDAEGNLVGSTYPKRAKGLVKSGRAEYIGENAIRLLAADDPSAFRSIITEAKKMGNVIEFKAMDFGFVKSCETNAGARMIVTLGDENVQCFEIGNREGDQTQIFAEKAVEPETDYVFRFAIRVAPGIWSDATGLAAICYGDDPENEITFPLDRADRNRFKPAICKRYGDELFRVYEIPFHTDGYDRVRLMLVVRGMTAWVYPAKEPDAYAEMTDVSYDQWRSEEEHRWTAKLSGFGRSVGEGMSDLGDQIGETFGDLGERISRAVNGAWSRASEAAENYRAERAAKAAEKSAEERRQDITGTAEEIVRTAEEEIEKAVQEAKEAVAEAVEAIRQAGDLDD